MKYLPVIIYKPASKGFSNHDYSNNGITNSSEDAKFFIQHPQGDVTEKQLDFYERGGIVCVLEEGRSGLEDTHKVFYADGVKGSFGGSFAFSTDSRFRSVSEYPIPIHDRQERKVY